MQAEIAKTKEAIVEVKNRDISAEGNVMSLDTSISIHEKELSTLTIEMAAVKAKIVDLERDATMRAMNTTTVHVVDQDSSKAVIELDGKMTNLTRKFSDGYTDPC